MATKEIKPVCGLVLSAFFTKENVKGMIRKICMVKNI
jgi:hypothetical protein